MILVIFFNIFVYIQWGKRYLARWLRMVISASNLHQKLKSMADLESSFNSTFKTILGSLIWWKIMGFMKVSKLLSQIPKWLKTTQKKDVKCFQTYIKKNIKGNWIYPSESQGFEDFKTGIAFENWPNMKPIPSKTRKVEKTHFFCSQLPPRQKRGENILTFNFENFITPTIFLSNLTSRDTFECRIESAIRIWHKI